MIYGYARVSTAQQDYATQIDDLKRAGASKIFKDKYTGTTANRPEFDKLMDKLQNGDTLIVTKLERECSDLGANVSVYKPFYGDMDEKNFFCQILHSIQA